MESCPWDQNFVPGTMLCPSEFSQLPSENEQLDTEPMEAGFTGRREKTAVGTQAIEWLFVIPLFLDICSGLSQDRHPGL